MKNPIGLGIKTRETATDAWISYVERYEVATKMARLAAEWDLKNSKYSDGKNFPTFITVMRNKWAKANSLGSSIDDDDFKSILLTSLPSSWTPIIAICLKDGTSTETISLLKTWSLHFSQNKFSNPVIALQVSRPPQRDQDQLLCVNPNCNHRGHTIKTCYWLGGGKEGQFSPGFGKYGGARGTALNTCRGGFRP